MVINKKIKLSISLLITLFLLINFLPTAQLKAETVSATAVSIGSIDYDNLTIQIFYNNNTIVYYSTDNTEWTEVEGDYDSTTKSCQMDISWISSTSEATLYFKGNLMKTVKEITLPMNNTSFSVDYDKVEGEFTFDNLDDADSFEWRKSTDYHWISVDFDETSSSYKEFLKTMEYLRVTGGKIIFRTPQVKGTGINYVGIRPSKEVTVTIITRSAAPSIKVNSSKLSLNTTASMEYYDPAIDLWIECSSSMSLDEIAPQTLYENGAKTTTLMLRKAATNSAPYSKTAVITIPGQSAPPTVGDSSADVTYYYMNSKLMLQFNKATTKNLFEYAIVKEDYSFDVTRTSWKTVSSSNLITLTRSSAPDGCTIYIRKKGTDAGKYTDLVLSSAVKGFVVEYQ